MEIIKYKYSDVTFVRVVTQNEYSRKRYEISDYKLGLLKCFEIVCIWWNVIPTLYHRHIKELGSCR